MSADPLQTCPKCQGKLVKVLYPTGVVFKGSGFYTTDYKASGRSSEGNGSSPAADGKPESSPDPKPDSKLESKAESKAESKPESKSDSAD